MEEGECWGGDGDVGGGGGERVEGLWGFGMLVWWSRKQCGEMG